MRENFVDSNHWCWGDYKCDPVLNKKKYGYDGGDCWNNNHLFWLEGCKDLNCCDDVTKPFGM